ncbi:hypothetical protein [Nitrobacter hamburgensis]|jgi:hypothetical protein|nr:hypothetical protein [Nitrobacter hamburgensis]
METQGFDPVGPSGSTSGIAAEDIMWAFGISAVVLGLTPLMAVYVLLVA